MNHPSPSPILVSYFNPETLQPVTASSPSGLETLEQVDAVLPAETLVRSGKAFRIHSVDEGLSAIYSWLDFGLSVDAVPNSR